MQRFRWTCVVLVSLCAARAVSQDKYFDSNGVRLHYVDGGAGEPVLLLHGYSNSVKLWEETGVSRGLRQDHRVIALDARGHAKSDKPRDPAAYGAEMGRDALRLLD